MSKDTDYYRAAANQAKARAQALESEKKQVQGELERLEAARKKLAKEIESYSRFKKSVAKIGSDTDKTKFHGNVRSKFDTKLSSIGTKMNSFQNSQEANLSKLDLEIAAKKLKVFDLAGAIGSAWQSFSDFMASIF